MSDLKPGARLSSAVCTTEVVVIAAPAAGATISCGGAPMLAEGDAAGDASLSADAASGTVLGKRYTDAAGELELLCVKAGEGALAVDGVALELKGAKPLPSSD